MSLAAGLVVLVPGSTSAATKITSFSVKPIEINRTVLDITREPSTEGGRRGSVNERKRADEASTGGDDSSHEDPVQDDPSDGSERRAPTEIFSLPGLDFTGVFPPDTVGEVGTTHYVQMVNDVFSSRVGIFRKGNGSLVTEFRLSTLAPFDSVCDDGAGDPIPVFDQQAERWLLTEFVDEFVADAICIYVSTGPNPLTSTWVLYEVPTPSFPDYPKYAVGRDAYFIGTNEPGNPTYALDRRDVLAGRRVNGIRARGAPRLSGFGFQLLTPVDTEGPNWLPADAAGIFIRHRDDEAHNTNNDPANDFIEVFELTPDFESPADSVFSGPQKIEVAEFSSSLCGLFSFKCIPQPGTSVLLDPLREVVMHRPVVRRFGSPGAHQSLIGSFAVDVNGNDRAAVRWFELRRPVNATTGGWTLFQEGTVAGSGHRWLPSISMNGEQSIAIGYSVSSSSIHPSIRYTGRTVDAAPGQMDQGETSLFEGARSQTITTRWGDYSAMTVDPVDDSTFWYTNEYVGSKSRWRTRIGKFTLGPP